VVDLLEYREFALQNFNKWSKNFDVATSRGVFSLGKFYLTLCCFCDRPVGMLVDSMRENIDVRATGNGACRHVGKSRRYLVKIAASYEGSGPHLIHGSLGPTE